MARGFDAWRPATGELADLRSDAFPTVLSSWSAGTLDLPEGATHHGVVRSGTAIVEGAAGTFSLSAGMYFALPGGGRVGGDGDGLVVSALGHRGLFQVGGPLEATGRLRYIDGCSDTLLVPPARLGDPCLNALYFPPATDQTQHTHPSLRAGIVMSGRGVCRLGGEQEVPLLPGVAFVIRTDCLHSFATAEEPMVVVAYHPDSDVGPTDEEHPMISRTIVDGVPANRLAR